MPVQAGPSDRRIPSCSATEENSHERKQRILLHSEEYGDVYISEEVLEMIAGAAALDVDGVTGLSGGTMSEQILGRKKLSKGITILWESDNITINVSIQIRYGGIIPEIAKKVQEAIISSVEDTSGLKVAAVNVRVGGVTFEKPED